MPAPFEIVTTSRSKKVGAKGVIIALIVVTVLVAGVAAGVVLVRQQQNIQEKAAVNLCPTAEECPVPGQGDLLRSCNPSNADGTPQEISCSNIDNVKKVVSCSTKSYCCPSLGASWTTDVALCSTPTPTPIVTLTPSPAAMAAASASASATPTATATGSATPTATATSSATPAVLQTTPRPIPQTGTNWPTVVGVGVGILVIVGSILLAI
jgi:hypothetical protein